MPPTSGDETQRAAEAHPTKITSSPTAVTSATFVHLDGRPVTPT